MGISQTEIGKLFGQRRHQVAVGQLTQDQYVRETLAQLGVEIDPSGQVILYHATTAELLASIWTQKAIKPSALTGERVYRTPLEETDDPDDLDKKEKVYLATREEIERSGDGIAAKIQDDRGGGIYILRVKVDQANLEPDEDNSGGDWLESLARYSHSCSHRGPIIDFKIARRIPARLSEERRLAYVQRTIKAIEAGYPEKASAIEKEAKAVQEQIQRQEDDLLRSVAIQVETIPS